MNSGNDTLRVAAVPVDIAFADKEANIAAAHRAVDALPDGFDIIVLPELYSTGYANDAEAMRPLAEPLDGLSLKAALRIARDYDAAVCGSYVALDDAGGKVFNRAFFVQPDGKMTFYDKRHLFSLSSESQVFAHGCGHVPVVEWRGWRVAMAVCYDLRFPAWLRNSGYAYDIMLLPANWPQARVYALEHLLIARAIENQAPIVCANRSGCDAYGVYDGCSFAFDHMGRPAFVGDTLAAEFSLDALCRARSRFPAAKDADSFVFT